MYINQDLLEQAVSAYTPFIMAAFGCVMIVIVIFIILLDDCITAKRKPGKELSWKWRIIMTAIGFIAAILIIVFVLVAVMQMVSIVST